MNLNVLPSVPPAEPFLFRTAGRKRGSMLYKSRTGLCLLQFPWLHLMRSALRTVPHSRVAIAFDQTNQPHPVLARAALMFAATG